MSLRRRGHGQDAAIHSASSTDFGGEDSDVPPVRRAPSAGGGTRAKTADEVKAAESKLEKLFTRLRFGTPMIAGFFVLVWLGHVYMVLLVCFLQVLLFKELVNVTYKPAKERHVPAFRTVQWAMFAVAMCHVYGRVFVNLGFVHSAAERLPNMFAPLLRKTIKYYSLVTFSGYVVTFVGFVLSLRPGLYKYQIGNTVWTIGVLSLVVWQLAGTTELIFEGLVWFMLPCGLVVANDCFAYFCGFLFGKKLIKFPFLALSPNKTWEGFIGGFFCTAIWGWWYADLISESRWLVCPQRDSNPFASLDCEPANLFKRQRLSIPSKEFELLSLTAKPFLLHAMMLSMFASVVAPFGGFLASAIKRAYNIKDFDSIIPGHGGLMDRMDCQFLMLLCTHVHHRTFVQAYDDLSEKDLLRVVGAMNPVAREGFLQRLFEQFNCTGSCVPQ